MLLIKAKNKTRKFLIELLQTITTIVKSS